MFVVVVFVRVCVGDGCGTRHFFVLSSWIVNKRWADWLTVFSISLRSWTVAVVVVVSTWGTVSQSSTVIVKAISSFFFFCCLISRRGGNIIIIGPRDRCWLTDCYRRHFTTWSVSHLLLTGLRQRPKGILNLLLNFVSQCPTRGETRFSQDKAGRGELKHVTSCWLDVKPLRLTKSATSSLRRRKKEKESQ